MDGRTYTKQNEQLRLIAYDDATGKPVPTDGEGHYEKPQGTITNGYGHTGSDVWIGQKISETQADAWFDQDYPEAENDAALLVGSKVWRELNDVRQVAITDMAFDLGGAGLSRFADMLKAVRVFDWKGAAGNVLGTPYEKEVGDRARSNAQMILTGNPPAGFEVAAAIS